MPEVKSKIRFLLQNKQQNLAFLSGRLTLSSLSSVIEPERNITFFYGMDRLCVIGQVMCHRTHGLPNFEH